MLLAARRVSPGPMCASRLRLHFASYMNCSRHRKKILLNLTEAPSLSPWGTAQDDSTATAAGCSGRPRSGAISSVDVRQFLRPTCHLSPFCGPLPRSACNRLILVPRPPRPLLMRRGHINGPSAQYAIDCRYASISRCLEYPRVLTSMDYRAQKYSTLIRRRADQWRPIYVSTSLVMSRSCVQVGSNARSGRAYAGDAAELPA